MKKIYFIAWLFVSMICVGLSSCGEDPDIMEIPGSETDPGTDENEGAGTETDPEEDTTYMYADVHFILSCSEDLLDYVTPQVTYINEAGRSVTVQIAESEWMENEAIDFGITFDDASFDAKIMKCTKTFRFKEFPIDNEMMVTYLPRANMPDYDKTRLNMFYHNLTVAMDFVDEKNNHSFSTSPPDVSYKLHFTLDEITEFYIEDMGIPYIDQNEYRTYGFILGADNDVIKEIIGDYQDVQGISVESDGTYMLKYDQDDLPVFKKEPKVDITYTLNCSADLLEHANPEVTYTGDDGKTVTYQLEMSDFEVNERVNKWAKHLHGDENLRLTDEDARIMKWTKQIHYENLQAVDDEMTVRYIPKDDTEKLRISHIYHNLSTAFCLVDTDGNTNCFTSANKIKSNIVEGENQLVWEFYDSEGNYFCFQTTSFTDREFYDGDGNFRKTGDIIVQSYKDYQGYHIESDGTYIQK